MSVQFGDEWQMQSGGGIVSVRVKKGRDPDDERLKKLNEVLPSLFLVGPMGAGKTTVGKILAKQMGRSFIDCDQYVSGRAGADIPWIFAKEGESGFREREHKALGELSVLSKIVMATGGGAVEWESNHTLLKKGFVIYLDASVDIQLARTKNSNRPLLMQGNPREVLEERYKKRHPLYLLVADMVIMTGRAYPKQMASEILMNLCKMYHID